jgi:hypothetical protein
MKNSIESPKTKENVPLQAIDTSDQALVSLLKRIKASDDENEIRELTRQLERIVFHKQFENA